ncbi:hypothetical protein Ddc_24400 [Ditylenchus destructor]|nr:hypothetical protein Ddc_24400 [Ditylenchus destructor]
MIFLSLIFCFNVALGTSLDYDVAREVTELSTLSNRLIQDESLSILHVSVLSTPEQRKNKGKNNDIVLNLQSRIEEYENSLPPEFWGYELRQLPLLPAVEASGKGPVFVVNNPFFDRNHTLNDIRTQERCWGAAHCALPPVKEHNFTVSSDMGFEIYTNGLQYLTGLLSTLAKRYSEGLNLKVQLVPLLVSRRVRTVHNTMMTQVYYLNAGVALVAPEEGGVKPLAAVVLKLKEKSDHFGGPIESFPEYYDYVDPVYPTGEHIIGNDTGITFPHS